MIYNKIVKFTGKPIPICPTVDTLFPTVSMDGNISIEANFGDDSAKPFKYDIKKCQHFEMTGVKRKILDVGKMV
jgi:hypothetical protein